MQQSIPGGYQKVSTLTKSQFHTSRPQNRKAINFCHLNHIVCVIFLWQPQETNTYEKEHLLEY
jgi:hypothetical protein